MFMNERQRPLKFEFNQAILRRIHPNHPKTGLIEADIGRVESGYYGEITLDSYLRYLPDKNYYIFKGLRLPTVRGTHFQIDSLILTPTHIPIVEAKNLSGTIEVDENCDQLIQNGEKGYENPMVQAEYQLRELRQWLRQKKFPCKNLEYLVGMMNKNCILKIEPASEAQFRMCRGRRVIDRLQYFKAKYQDIIYPPDILQKMCKHLLKSHVEPSYDIEKCYKISRTELLPGVYCPFCHFLGMVYRSGTWHCPRCKGVSKDAYLPALKDYFLLHGPEITNRQFREFLRLDSINIASKRLNNLDLPFSGTFKDRVYKLSFDLFK